MMRVSKPGLLAAGLVLITSCARLPSSLRQDVAYQNDRLRAAERQLQSSKDTLSHDLSQAPDMFQAAAAPAQWQATLRSDGDKLRSAERIQTELDQLARRDRADSQPRVEQLLAQERQLLKTVAADEQTVTAAAAAWLDFKSNVPAHLDEMRREYAQVRDFDLAPVTKDVEQAVHDWPAKRTALDERLDGLHDIQKEAEAEWNGTEAVRNATRTGKPAGTQLATLIQTDNDLATDDRTIAAKAAELHDLCGQLYYSWDKILTDLDDSRYDGRQVFRERIKTVRTHFLDLAAKKTETSSDEHWVTVSEPEFRAVQNDLGMAIAHKDAGLFDSEANTTPEPAGFAYIAPESQGSNQYGYWDHSSGHAVWTWLPQYLLLRELLWNHDYRPVVLDEYRAYRTAEKAGRTYYGETIPGAPPKYGTHGTFTETHYANSRYAQHGGFGGSAYASRRGTGMSVPGSEPRSEPRFGDESAGRRFGSGVHPPSGHQFGRPGGFRAGRRFGGRR